MHFQVYRLVISAVNSDISNVNSILIRVRHVGVVLRLTNKAIHKPIQRVKLNSQVFNTFKLNTFSFKK